MTRRELYNNMCRLAEPIYGSREATQITRMLFEEMFGVDRMELLRNPDTEIPVSGEECQRLLKEIEQARPIQYIIGEAEFCDFRVTVREGCLIPRPESEELIRWVTSDNQIDINIKILDIGTGSGALAIALAQSIESAEVTALDISDDAIAIAKENIAKLAPNIKVIKGDAIAGVERVCNSEWDIIISNPPYIPQSEEQAMRCNVTKHEPHLALFVPDSDPLIFYRSIARSAQKILKEGGKLYFEIHENFALETKEMLHSEGFSRVEVRLDINDKARMICAQR